MLVDLDLGLDLTNLWDDKSIAKRLHSTVGALVRE